MTTRLHTAAKDVGHNLLDSF